MTNSNKIDIEKYNDVDTDISKDKVPFREATTKTTKNHKVISSRDADATLAFIERYDSEVPEITPEEESRLSRKVTWIILLLTSVTDLLLYADKVTLAYGSTFELWVDTNMTQNRYNNSNTLFYVGFIIGQLNLILVQKFPIGKLLSLISALWTMIIFLHCTAHNYQGIYALRFFLGFVESVAIPILNTTMSQFLTVEEKAATAPMFYSACMGVTIPVGFIAYGILHVKNSSVSLWKLFFIIIGGCTFLLTVLITLIYPNNPSDAKFLSTKEKVWVIRRVQKSTGASIEQKTIKKYQFLEAIKDPISWGFFLFFLMQQLANNLTYQQNLLFQGMGGLSDLNTTLVSVAGGGFAVICCIIATTLLYIKPNITAFSVVFWTLPAFCGSIGAATINWNNKIALLAMVSMSSNIFGIPWILMFSWNTASCSGYTKRLTRNAIVLVGYSIANLISPQLWQEKDGPRYIPAWVVQIVLSFFMAPLLALIIWFVLNKRNSKRLSKIAENNTDEQGIGFVKDTEGQEVKVNLAALDLTDLENEEFVYPL